MSYTRKTRDEFQVQSYTGRQYGWEEVTAEETRKEALQRLREYRENEPQYPHRLRKVRVPLAAAFLALLLSALPTLAADTKPEPKTSRPRPTLSISVKVYPEKFAAGGPFAGQVVPHISTLTKTSCTVWIPSDADAAWTAGLKACRKALRESKE